MDAERDEKDVAGKVDIPLGPEEQLKQVELAGVGAFEGGGASCLEVTLEVIVALLTGHHVSEGVTEENEDEHHGVEHVVEDEGVEGRGAEAEDESPEEVGEREHQPGQNGHLAHPQAKYDLHLKGHHGGYD